MCTKTSLCQVRQGVEQDQASALMKFILSSLLEKDSKGAAGSRSLGCTKENDTEVLGRMAWNELDGQKEAKNQTLQAEKAEGRCPKAKSKLGCQRVREE